ncbi:MAG: 50S ribosomal protein L18a [Methanobacteriota archaeon]|nr:MAG: 50S ribosomal protein L18a [Euryarchaeota archaeon]
MYEVKGYNKALKRPFTKKVDAKSENAAIEKVLSLFGSNNGIRRSMIEVKEVKEVQ